MLQQPGSWLEQTTCGKNRQKQSSAWMSTEIKPFSVLVLPFNPADMGIGNSGLEANAESRAPLAKSACWACTTTSYAIAMHWALCFATLLNPTAGVSSPASLLCRSSCVYASSFATCQKNITWWRTGEHCDHAAADWKEEWSRFFPWTRWNSHENSMRHATSCD